jgi:hypothetical protein
MDARIKSGHDEEREREREREKKRDPSVGINALRHDHFGLSFFGRPRETATTLIVLPAKAGACT